MGKSYIYSMNMTVNDYGEIHFIDNTETEYKILVLDMGIFKGGKLYFMQEKNMDSKGTQVTNESVSKNNLISTFYPYITKFVDGEEMKGIKKINFNYKESDRVLIRGMILKDGKATKDLTLEVFEIDGNNNKTSLGNIISDGDYYNLNFPIRNGYDYKLVAEYIYVV